MHCRDAILETRSADPLSTTHVTARTDLDVTQIGGRDLEPADWLDGDGLHPGHRAGEGDSSGYGRMHRLPERCLVVDAPMTAVTPRGRISGAHVTVDGRDEADGGDGEEDTEH